MKEMNTDGRPYTVSERKSEVSEMCRIMEDMRTESLKEVALRMHALEEIANSSGLSLDEVKN